jgi:predicted secreted acid phosphatase
LPVTPRRALLAVLAVALLSACATHPSGVRLAGGRTIPNLSDIKHDIVQYHASGQWASDLRAVAADAQVALDERRPTAVRPAIVFDIDDTLLSNYPIQQATNFGFVQPLWTAWAEKDRAPPNPGVLELYQHAVRQRVAVFLITGRPEAFRAATERQLRLAGIDGWTGLHLKPGDYREPSVIPYKSGVRRRIAGEGYQILVNIGDQWSDLEGGFAETTFKLPNPMYIIP